MSLLKFISVVSPPLYLLKISQTSIDLQIGRIKGIPYLIGKRVTVSDADRQPEYAELQISHIDAKAVNIGGKNCQFSAKIGHTLLLQMTNQTDDHCPRTASRFYHDTILNTTNFLE